MGTQKKVYYNWIKEDFQKNLTIKVNLEKEKIIGTIICLYENILLVLKLDNFRLAHDLKECEV